MSFPIFSIMEVDLKDLIFPISVAAISIAFTGQVNVIANAWDHARLLERNRVDCALRIHIPKGDAIFGDAFHLAEYLELSVQSVRRVNENRNADESDNVGSKASWIWQLESHAENCSAGLLAALDGG